MTVLLVTAREDFAVDFVEPVVEPIQRANRRVNFHIHAQVPEPAKTGGDVEGDVIVAATAGEPGPRAVGQLHLRKLPQRVFRFVIEAVVIEQNPDVAPRLAFALGLTQPRCLFNHNAFKVLVLLQRAVQRRGVAPLLEHAVNLRVGASNETRECVRVKPVEGLLGALVRELHQIRQRHHRVPRRVRHHLHREPLVLQRL